MKPILELPAVMDDLELAVEHYLTWRDDGEEHFEAKYLEAVDLVRHHPDLYPRKIGDVQAVVLRQSYYILYYLQEPARTVILAALDGRRNPRELNRIVRVRKTSRR